MTTSTHKAEVVRISECFPIENADRLVRVDVFGGYPVVIGKTDFVSEKLWIYIPPDSLVDITRKEFSFLAEKANKAGFVRIRTIKLRNQVSMGLLIPAPLEAKEGQDYAEKLGVVHYEPPTKGPSYTAPSSSRSKIQKWVGIITHRSIKFGEKPPKIHVPYYDIDALRRFKDVYKNKLVVVTEKIHGSNVSMCWKNRGLLHKICYWNKEQNLRVRSRTIWKKIESKNWYTDAVTEDIKTFLSYNSDLVLFGEVYGPGVQGGFDYGVKKPTFIGFDLWNYKKEKWLDYYTFLGLLNLYRVPTVPVLYYGIFDFDHILTLAEGLSTIGGLHVREGVVILSLDEAELIRKLKCVGLGYYEK